MEFELNHRNLNLFRHFGDSADNEGNTTRAFLIATSRSPWSPVLLRAFLDLVASRVRQIQPAYAEQLEKFLVSWPDRVEFSLERNITPESFPGPDVRKAIIVELTPQGIASEQSLEERELGTGGRVDATIVARTADGDGLGVVIESKLYHRAGLDQLARYQKGLKAKRIEAVSVQVSWEDVYGIADSLPDAADGDPIISDFKSFLQRDPRLTGFIGFSAGDFFPENDLLDPKLERFCNRLLTTVADPIFGNATLERKRGGLDYDILLAQQAGLIGNLGLATWEGKDALYAKLVVGWRSRWQIDRLLSVGLQSKRVSALIRELAKRVRLEVHATLRPYFSRFDYPSAAGWNSGVILPDKASYSWSEALEFARRFHAKPFTGEGVHQVMASCNRTNSELLDRAAKEAVNCFVPVDLIAHWEPEQIAAYKPEDQVKTVKEILSALASILLELSECRETSG